MFFGFYGRVVCRVSEGVVRRLVEAVVIISYRVVF